MYIMCLCREGVGVCLSADMSEGHLGFYMVALLGDFHILQVLLMETWMYFNITLKKVIGLNSHMTVYFHVA